MIMQMRTKREMFSKRVLKEDLLETVSDPEITEGCRRRLQGVFDSYQK